MSWSNFGRPLQAQECDVGRIVCKGFFKFIESLAEGFDLQVVPQLKPLSMRR